MKTVLTFKMLYYYLKSLGAASMFFPFFVLIYILLKKIEIEKEIRLFVVFLFFASFTQLFTTTIMNLGYYNLWFHHIYAPIEFGLFSFLLIQWESKYKKLFIKFATAFTLFRLVEIFFVEEWNKFNTTSMTFQSLLLFALAARIFYSLSISSIIPFFRDFRFFITFGILFFNSTISAGFIFMNFFDSKVPLYVYQVSNLITNIIFTIAMICYYRQKQRILKAF